MFLAFLFKWAIALTLLYSLYGLLLRRETFYRVNRFVLLAMLPFSAWLATLHLETTHINAANEAITEITEWMTAGEQTATVADTPTAPPPTAPTPTASTTTTSTISGVQLLIYLYYIGLAFCVLQYLFALFQVVRLIRKGRPMENDATNPHLRGAKGVINDSVPSPFSWFRWIVISSKDLAENGRVFLAHERAHVSHGHSWDMLLCEFCVRLQWFNPFAWQLREDLRAIHEFQADRSVIREGCNIREYNMLLIDKALGGQLAPVANALTHGELQRRIRMMYRKPSPWIAMFKVLYIVPFALVTLAIFAKPIAVQNIVNARSVDVLAGNVRTLVDPTQGDAQPTPETHPQPLPAGRGEVTTTKEEANEKIGTSAALPQPPSTVQSAPLPRREGPGGGSADVAEIKSTAAYQGQRAERAIEDYLKMSLGDRRTKQAAEFPIEITLDSEGNITQVKLDSYSLRAGETPSRAEAEALTALEHKVRAIPHELTRDYVDNTPLPAGQETHRLVINLSK